MTKRGEARAYVRVATNHVGKECLIWPFARSADGYARSSRGPVSREVCEAVNGPAPTPEHQAAHTCGNGHAGCVSGAHLRWKTRAENEADKLAHGTSSRGEGNGFAILSAAQVAEIRSLKGTAPQHVIAKRFGVHQSQISRIVAGERWA